MKPMPQTSAAQTAVTYSSGRPGGVPSQGSGRYDTASRDAAPIERAERAIVLRPERMLAATVTGASSSGQNGLRSDRKSVVSGTSVSVRVDIGGREIINI